MIVVAPRARSRPVAPPATPMGYPVVGGPLRPADWPAGAVFPTAYYHTLPGQPIKHWPWRTGNRVIGMYFSAYKRKAYDGVHVYRLADNEWRYAGKVSNTEQARSKIEDLYDKAQLKVAVQPVAPAPRARVRN